MKMKKFVPEFIYQSNDEFKVCYKCGRVFWKGNRHKEINSLLWEIIEGVIGEDDRVNQTVEIL